MVQTKFFWVALALLMFQKILFAQTQTLPDTALHKIDSLIKLSGQNWSIDGPYEHNIDWLLQAERISHDSKNWEKQVECLLRLTTVYKLSEDSTQFNRVVLSAHKFANSYLPDNHRYYLNIYSNMADLHLQKGEYRKSNEYLEKGIHFCDNCSFYSLSKFYNKLSSNYLKLGDYSKAKKYLNSAVSLEFNKTENDYFRKYHMHYIYTILSKRTKDFNGAIMHLDLAEEYLTTFYRKDYLNELVNLWFEYIEIYLEQNEINRAKKYLIKIEESNFLHDPLSSAKYKIGLAKHDYLFDKKLSQDLIKSIKEGNQILREIETTDINLDLLISENIEFQADIYFENNLYAEALTMYNMTLEELGYNNLESDFSSINHKGNIIIALYKILKIHLQLNNFHEIERLQNEVLTLIRKFRIENSSASTIDYWAVENLKIFENMIEYNFDQKKFPYVFSLIEENKSNVLIQDIVENESVGYTNIDQEILEKGNQLNIDLSYCRKRIFEIKRKQTVDSTLLIKWNTSESKLQIELDSYLRNLENAYPDYYNLKYNLRAFQLNDVQDQLDNNAVLLEYFIGDKKSYVAAISNKDIKIVEIDKSGGLKNLAFQFYKSLSDKRPLEENNSEELYEALQLNILQDINLNASKLIIIADDFLNNIPFETLVDNHGKSLMDKYSIQYQYSARLWQMLKSRKSKDKALDFIGYAYNSEGLDFASERSCATGDLAAIRCAIPEVKSALNIINSDAVKQLDGDIDTLFDAVSDTKILHLATHACLDESNSDYSRIYFNDTLLTSQELKLKDLSAELVVLSACETGFGEVIKGEGSMSLSKDFFHAGAKSTLVSLWPVDDCATFHLMKYFYQNLKEGQTKDKALSNAKISYQQYANPEKTHPYYWAGFIVIGDCSPIWNDSNHTWIYLLVFLGVIGCIWIIKLFQSLKFSG